MRYNTGHTGRGSRAGTRTHDNRGSIVWTLFYGAHGSGATLSFRSVPVRWYGDMRKVLLAVLVVVVLILAVAVVQRFITSRDNQVFDFLLRWHGAQAMLFEGKDPYSRDVTNRIQMQVFGRPFAPGQCQQGFLYPAHVALTIPHFLLPAPLALSTWIVTQQVLVVTAIWLIVASAHRRSGMGLARLLLLTLAGATYFYSVRNLAYAQFSIWVLFWLVLGWWLWERGRYLPAGVALSLVASKPQLAFLILPLWLLLAVVRRRWSFVAGLAGALAAWLILPAYFIGNWIPGFFDMARLAADTCQDPMYEGSGLALKLGVAIPLFATVSVAWFRSLKRQREANLGFLLSVSVGATLFVTPFIHHYDLVLTLLPLLYGLTLLGQARGAVATALQTAYWAVLLVLPWILWTFVPANAQESVQLWVVPLVVLALLVALFAVGKRQWTSLPVRETRNLARDS